MDKLTRIEIQFRDDGTIGAEGIFLNEKGVPTPRGIDCGSNPEYGDKIEEALGAFLKDAVAHAQEKQAHIDDIEPKLEEATGALAAAVNENATLRDKVSQLKADNDVLTRSINAAISQSIPSSDRP